MKLLFDQNLSFKLCRQLAELFPASDQVRRLGFDQSSDREIWHYAKDHGFVIVSQDSDFADMAALFGPPPKVIWLRCGNQPTAIIENILRNHAADIIDFGQDLLASCLELG
ncbi:MAG: DUF5615 family PIN-like protein [Bacteroidota bacterium]|nr:DUF5615 family PIN-like protein [Bacteroidota bacterium]MDP4232230.1 DUF5615 family PIN-like protein [Bacteroidota bacterium]MDP4243590.1 DUF5615 family PIN-like protein [Bacteroidota bacterium]MDP4289125.1 DUF5615 family PIN-like protein [Bacteroidota bacterium]